MEGLFTLLALSIVMAVTSFVVGSLPLALTLSASQLRLISSIGMGVLVGTSLIVIIPEGIETLYSANAVGRKTISARASTVVWPCEGLIPTASVKRDVYSSGLPPTIPVPFLDIDPATSLPHGHRDAWWEPSYALRARRNENPSDKEKHGKEEEEEEERSSPHAWIGVALISGFILMYLIDKVPEYASPTKPDRQPYHISLDNLGSGLRRSSSPARPDSLLEAGPSHQQHGHSFATTMGLVIHAAADGIALGATSTDTGLSFIIFLAIMVHKAPASFGLTSILLKQGLSARTARAHLLVFSLAAPIGALATFLFAHLLGTSNGDEAASLWRTGMLLLFSGGTFLYVAVHTMQENGPASTSREMSANRYSDSRDSPKGTDKSMRDLVASVLGMILPLFLQIGHAH
ncbi:Zinc transporter ZIP9 [Penicillium oxalicum]|uniref:Zinc transporter ZIP9 n=1 Tax=Penicillium oxalicum TaxID=69781 RepID=UPI0020B689C7|nr:Zinc transporter ZIP9 [Penicillium oxalicum]KAI2789196.1 Zinc transporter ZIP9 [Penicillium oxalicum]